MFYFEKSSLGLPLFLSAEKSFRILAVVLMHTLTIFVGHGKTQAAQTLFVIYIRDSIALRFKPFKRMYENGSKIALNSTCSKGFK